MNPPARENAKAKTALQKLQDFPKFSTAGLSMQAVTSGPSGNFETYRIPLTVDAAAEISAIAEDSRTETLSQTPLEYGPAVLIPPDHVMHVSVSQAASLSAILAQVVKDDSSPLAHLTDRLKIKFLAARFTADSGEQVVFFRIADALSQLKPSKFLALVREGETYGRLEQADVMLMRRTFEVTVVDGTAFFVLKSSFERAFGFLDQLKASSAATFDEVTASLRIKGLEQMKAACTKQSQMMAKMASIRRSMNEDPQYAAAMTMERLLAFVAARDYIDIEIATENGKQFFVYNDDVRTRFQILKLLDDDYLHSVLTDRDYESGSKILPE